MTNVPADAPPAPDGFRPGRQLHLRFAAPVILPLTACLVFALASGDWRAAALSALAVLVPGVVVNAALVELAFVRRAIGLLNRSGPLDAAEGAFLTRLPVAGTVWCIGVTVVAITASVLVPQSIGTWMADRLATAGVGVWPLILALAISVAIIAFFQYFLLMSYAGRLRRVLFERFGRTVPAGHGKIGRRMALVVGLVALVPALWLTLDVFFFEAFADAIGMQMSLRTAVLVDLAISVAMICIALVFLPGSLTEPIVALVRATDRVAAGDLDVRVPVTTDDEAGVLTDRFNAMVAGLRDRERVRETFGRFVNPKVADRLLRGEIDPGGRVMTATILFTDITGFTEISERLAPKDTIALLNDYLALVVPAIQAEHGVINNFMGDGVFAAFNVPLADPDHAAHAVRAALAIQRRLAGRRFGPGDGVALRTRIGITTGPVVDGTVGTPTRQSHAILGDTVNLAARLEEKNRELGTNILVCSDTRDLAGDEFAFHDQRLITIRGRREAVHAYSIPSDANLI